ncbi:MAG: M81 family metallopeptidase, partial [Rudanella sp.]|nr:M81 family metallopeptidase [Rudanella sp.]
MRHLLLWFTAYFPLVVSGLAQSPNKTGASSLPRIAIAGLGVETSTFSPALTHAEAFHTLQGGDAFNAYPFMTPGSALRQQAIWLPAMVGESLPGGPVTREAYESLVNKILNTLSKYGPYDGLYFDIHGAMSVQGLDDPEGDFLTRIRGVIGYQTLVSTSMDLHGNVSWRLAQNTDLMTCFRMAPHEDALQSKERAVVNLLERIKSGKGKPAYKALIAIPILLPGEQTSTRTEPGKSLYEQIAPLVDHQPGIVDAGIWIGYAWADEPRNHAAVMVTGDDRVKVTRSAEKLALDFWNARLKFAFVAPTATLDECLAKALSSPKRPFFISDMGDNPTAGGAGDVTWTHTQIQA